jgi:hypothetical protein
VVAPWIQKISRESRRLGRLLVSGLCAPLSFFVGLQAIRSGWSMLIFTMIVVVEVLVTRVPVNHLLHSMKHNPSLEPGVTTVPYAVPLMRASEMRTMSVIPRLRSFEGKLILPTALLKIGMVSEAG